MSHYVNPTKDAEERYGPHTAQQYADSSNARQMLVDAFDLMSSNREYCDGVQDAGQIAEAYTYLNNLLDIDHQRIGREFELSKNQAGTSDNTSEYPRPRGYGYGSD